MPEDYLFELRHYIRKLTCDLNLVKRAGLEEPARTMRFRLKRAQEIFDETPPISFAECALKLRLAANIVATMPHRIPGASRQTAIDLRRYADGFENGAQRLTRTNILWSELHWCLANFPDDRVTRAIADVAQFARPLKRPFRPRPGSWSQFREQMIKRKVFAAAKAQLNAGGRDWKSEKGAAAVRRMIAQEREEKRRMQRQEAERRKRDREWRRKLAKQRPAPRD